MRNVRNRGQTLTPIQGFQCADGDVLTWLEQNSKLITANYFLCLEDDSCLSSAVNEHCIVWRQSQYSTSTNRCFSLGIGRCIVHHHDNVLRRKTISNVIVKCIVLKEPHTLSHQMHKACSGGHRPIQAQVGPVEFGSITTTG